MRETIGIAIIVAILLGPLAVGALLWRLGRARREKRRLGALTGENMWTSIPYGEWIPRRGDKADATFRREVLGEFRPWPEDPPREVFGVASAPRLPSVPLKVELVGNGGQVLRPSHHEAVPEPIDDTADLFRTELERLEQAGRRILVIRADKVAVGGPGRGVFSLEQMAARLREAAASDIVLVELSGGCRIEKDRHGDLIGYPEVVPVDHHAGREPRGKK